MAIVEIGSVRPTPRTSPRARPLPPDERRAALIASTLPLLLEYGATVSTRMIADASGVAEGTIFGVFPDKESLIRATIDAALDPAPVLAQLDSLDTTGPLRPTLEGAVALLQERIVTIFRLFSVMEITRPPKSVPPHEDVNAIIGSRLQHLLTPFADELRCTTREAAKMLRVVIFAGSHSAMTNGEVLSPTEIVDLLLDGIAHHPRKGI
jgi:AcrR family transcriptional regulator